MPHGCPRTQPRAILATMATFEKEVLKVGKYRCRDGSILEVDVPYLQQKVKLFNAMTAKGIKVPIAWGHQPLAEPDDPAASDNDPAVAARREYLRGAMNAGYFADMRVTPEGGMVVKGSVPGAEVDADGNLTCWTKLEDGRQVKTAIGEVSVGLNTWTDGSGQTWPESVLHLALTPLPVATGLAPFKAALSTAPGRAPLYLSLSERISPVSIKWPSRAQLLLATTLFRQDRAKRLKRLELATMPPSKPSMYNCPTCKAKHKTRKGAKCCCK